MPSCSGPLTSYLAVFWLAFQLGALPPIRAMLLRSLLWFGFLFSALSVATFYNGTNKILGLIPGDVEISYLGPFSNRDHFAAFIELLLPLALYQALTHSRRFYLGAAYGQHALRVHHRRCLARGLGLGTSSSPTPPSPIMTMAPSSPTPITTGWNGPSMAAFSYRYPSSQSPSSAPPYSGDPSGDSASYPPSFTPPSTTLYTAPPSLSGYSRY